MTRDAGIGLGVTLLAVALRATYLVDSLDDPSFSRLLVDARTYHELAAGLAREGLLSEEFLWQAVGYPFFLAGVYKLFGVSVLAAKIIQVIVGGATCWLTWRLARWLFDPASALATGLICALYGPLIFFENQLLATGWAAFWLIALANLAVAWRERPLPLHGLLLGFAGAAAILLRPTFIPVVAILLVLLAWSGRRAVRTLQQAVLPVGVAGLVLVLTLGLVGNFLESATGRRGLVPPSGGINLYIGNNADYRETINIRPGFGWEDLVDEPRRHGYAANPWSGQSYFLGKVRRFALEQPWAFLQLQGHKGLQMISSRELARNQDIYLHRRWSPLLAGLVFRWGAFGFPFALVFPFAVVGIVAGGRRLWGPVLWPLILYGGAVVLVFVAARYRTPLVPLLAVLAGQGVVRAVRWWREGHPPVARWSFGLALLGLAAAVVPGPFAPETVDYEPEFHFGVGVSHYRLGEWDPAARHLAASVAMDPENPAPRNFLGISLARQQRFEEAVAQFEAAIALRPENAEVRRNLKRCRLMAADHHLGIGLARGPQAAAAAAADFRKALDFNDLNHEAALQLAWLLATGETGGAGAGMRALDLMNAVPAGVREQDYRFLYVRAFILALNGDFAQAINEAERGGSLVAGGGRTDLERHFTAALAAYGLGRIPAVKKMP
jgi:hypothetical protein